MVAAPKETFPKSGLAAAIALHRARNPMLTAFLDAAGADGWWVHSVGEPDRVLLDTVLADRLRLADPIHAPNPRPWRPLVDPQDVPLYESALKRLTAAPQAPVTLSPCLNRSDGTAVPMSCRAVIVPGVEDAGPLIAVAMTVRPRLSLPMAEPAGQSAAIDNATLRARAARLDAILSLAPVISFQWFEKPDGSRGFTEIAGRVADIYGVSAEEYRDDPDLLPVHPDDIERWDRSIRDAVAALSDWTFEGRFVLPDGSARWWLGKSHPERQPDGTVLFTGTIVDIHESKTRELALKDAHRRLEVQSEELQAQAEVMEQAVAEATRARESAELSSASKTAFLATMSHELRTPLNAILGYAELMGIEPYGPLGDDRYRDYVQDIRTSGLTLFSLIEDLFDLAKVEAGQKEIARSPVQVADLIDRCVRMIRPRVMDRHQSLRQQAVSAGLVAYVDERAVQQMLVNLLTNASKFTPPGGSLSVECQIGQNGILTLSVRDSGPGIPEADLERVFEPFERGMPIAGKPTVEGTGLGLSIVRALMQLHGGTVRAERPANGGARFVLTFPAGTARLTPRQPAGGPA